jgi:serine/threonine protein kinase
MATIEYDYEESSEQPLYRWPYHLAKHMADSIHGIVRDTLGQSRLVPRSETIQLARKEDIIHAEKLLGTGAFSEVASVLCRDGKKYACKHLKRELMQRPDEFRMAASELACEAHMLSSFDHPNILKIRGWSYNGIASFDEGCHDSFFLLLDVLDETLENRIDRWRMNPLVQFNDPSLYLQKLHIMSEIASALDYLHERGVVFRDLKPNNIGFLGNKVQLFDFGLSRELPSLDSLTPFEMSGKVGTLRYMANEVALNQAYNVSADVFSFAMVSYELLSTQKPYDGWTRDMHTALVCQRGLRPDTTNCVCPITLEMSLLLQLAWHGDSTKRPTTEQVVAQLEVLKEQQLVIFESQQLELQMAQHLEAQRRSQQEDAARALCIDLAYRLAPFVPDKYGRRPSQESIETIETASLSSKSTDVWMLE